VWIGRYSPLALRRRYRAILGARFTGRLDERQLLRAVGLVLIVAGAATTVQGIV